MPPEVTIRPARGIDAPLGEAHVPATADDDVVVHAETEQSRALAKLPREVKILLRRRGISRRVVVHENQVSARLEDRRAEHLARVDDRGREAPLRDLDVPQEAVLAIEQRDPEDLFLLALETGPEVARHLLRAREANAPRVWPGPEASR